MDLNFPRFVFTSPGPLACNGGSYGEHIVEDQKEFDSAMDAGFFPTLPEALAGSKKPKEAKPSTPAADPSEKAKLIARARELGIKADERWGIPNLQSAIAKAERGGA
jgi:hypothetical protein